MNCPNCQHGMVKAKPGHMCLNCGHLVARSNSSSRGTLNLKKAADRPPRKPAKAIDIAAQKPPKKV